MTICQIRKPFAAEDIPATLRRIADSIEAGEHGLATTCIIVIGHTGHEAERDGIQNQEASSRLFVTGPRADMFTVRGLLATEMIHLGASQ